ncbi:MAG: outer membrane beta-barrel protein [Bacteroidales bacterium]|jgi:opacity protein-like surface antigen|nr:outer membrane beta-barrel protein [Bacteroidales bacterium]
MRKLVIFLFSIFLAVSVYAQPEFATDAGSFSLGGEILSVSSYGGELYDDADNNRSFSVGLNPDFSVFVVPSLSIGAEFLVSYYLQGTYSHTSFGLGPSLVYYIAGHKERRVYPYIGVSFLFTKNNYKYSDSETDTNINSTYLTGRAGVLFMLSSAVGLNLEYNYTDITSGTDNKTAGNKLYLGLGVKYYIF